MLLMKHKKIIAISFNENEKNIKESIRVDKFNWDSMTKINLIANVDQKYKKLIDHKEFPNIKNFRDLDNLISKTIKK